jgi:hypothetical protein
MARNIRLIVLIASTLEAFVKIAGAATNVSAANGLWVNGVASISFLRLKLYNAMRAQCPTNFSLSRLDM